MIEKFLIPTPTPTGMVEIDERMPGAPSYEVFADAEGNELRWYGSTPLPKVGDRIYVNMNSIGYAAVHGYFACYDSRGVNYLEVMSKPEKPPMWLRNQMKRELKSGWIMPQWRKDGLGCEFGPEIAARKPRKTRKPKVAV